MADKKTKQEKEPEIEDEEEEEEKEETLQTPGVLDKYQQAGKIANSNTIYFFIFYFF